MSSDDFGGQDTRFGLGSQGDIRGFPGDRLDERPVVQKAWTRVVRCVENGRVVERRLPYKRMVTYVDGGVPVEEEQVLDTFDALGRTIRGDDLKAFSWTGLAVPHDCLGSCLNPFELHCFRLVYLLIDGGVTELGNVLCTECWQHQDYRVKWSKWLGFGLLYSPEVY